MKLSVNRKLVLNLLLFAVVIGLIYFVIRDSLSAIFIELLATSWPILLGVTALGVASLFVEGYTIKNIAGLYQPAFTIFDGVIACAYMMFYRVITFGTGSLVAEVVYYHKKELKISQGTGVVALRMTLYKLAILFWTFVLLLTQLKTLQRESPHAIYLIVLGMVATLAVVVVLLVLSSSLNAQVFLITLCNRLFKKPKWRAAVDQINLQIYSLRETIQTFLANRPVIWRVFLSNSVKLALWFLIPYFVLAGQHPKLGLILSIALVSFTVVLAGVIPSPGGIGSFEFIYVILFRQLVGKVDAASSLLLYRYSTYLLPFLVGMLYVLVTKQKQINSELKEAKAGNSQSSKKD